MEALYNSTFGSHDGILQHRLVFHVLLYKYRHVSDSAHRLIRRQHLMRSSHASGVRYSYSSLKTSTETSV
jgi:hypothetical protein